jgi:hypothetical protein
MPNGGTVIAFQNPPAGMRAQRFPLELSVEYRPVGREGWHRASTANISASGVLVREQNPPGINTQIEFRVLLPSRGVPDRGEVAGRGRVVRVAQQPDEPQTGFALVIEGYDFHSRSGAN